MFCSLVALSCRGEDVSRWVEQLAAESFVEREAASLALWTLGEASLEPLRMAVNSPDPEVRLRAAELLENIVLGLRPSWPEDLRLSAKRYRSYSPEQRKVFLRELVDSRKEESLSFLLQRVRDGEDADAGVAVEFMAKLMEAEENRRWVAARVNKPGNAYEAKLLSRLLLKEGELPDFVRLLASAQLGEEDRSALVRTALQKLRLLLDAKQYAELEAQAGQLGAVVPTEARFVYLQAAGLAFLGRNQEAGVLCARALEMNPEDKGAHFQAGELLKDLRQPGLALREWRRILEIPPQGDVYDINAYMRLGEIHASRNEFDAAADAFEAGLQGFRKAKASGQGGFGMVGAKEEDLEKTIAQLRERANEETEGLELQILASIKNDLGEELQKMRQKADVTLSVNIEPYGIKLFDVAPATLHYDATRGEVMIQLNGSAVGDGFPAEFKNETPVVAVHSLDMWYFFEMNTQEGTSTKTASFEIEYVLQITPNKRVAAWKTPGLWVNGTLHPWSDLAEGIPFDFLPENLEMEIRGTTPEGEEKSILLKADPAKLKHHFR